MAVNPSLNDIKSRLKELEAPELRALLQRLGRYKKENKELLHYLLFEVYDEAAYIERLKAETSDMFVALTAGTFYQEKKAVMKILRFLNRQIRYSGHTATSVELLLHFVKELRGIAPHGRKNQGYEKLLERLIGKIRDQISKLHEDLQFDYQRELDRLGTG